MDNQSGGPQVPFTFVPSAFGSTAYAVFLPSMMLWKMAVVKSPVSGLLESISSGSRQSGRRPRLAREKWFAIETMGWPSPNYNTHTQVKNWTALPSVVHIRQGYYLWSSPPWVESIGPSLPPYESER